MKIGQSDYFIVSNLKGQWTPKSVLRANGSQTHLICHLQDDLLTVKKVEEMGLEDTDIFIRTNSGYDSIKENHYMSDSTVGHTKVSIEDFCALGDDKVIIGNSLGVLEIFKFSLENFTVKKLSSFDLSKSSRRIGLEESVTCISLSKDGKKLAVATAIESEQKTGRNRLKKLLIFEIKENFHLMEIGFKDFGNEEPENSCYYFLEFGLDFKGIPMIFCFQNADEKRVDVFSFKAGMIELVCSEEEYHDETYSAIGVAGRSVVTVDFDGLMKVLTVPE
jgi:hypothetical protein